MGSNIWRFCKGLLFLSIIVVPMLCIEPDKDNKKNEDLFKKLFRVRRLEQLAAVKKISSLEDDKQHKMVKTVSKTLFNVISKSKVILENSGYVPGVSDFPEAQAVRDALSLVLENTALMGELVLRIPEASENELRVAPDWKELLLWGLAFANQTQLLDSTTSMLIHLVFQELNVSARSSNYINPYRKVPVARKPALQTEPSVKKKKKAAIQRGPRMSLQKAGEL